MSSSVANTVAQYELCVPLVLHTSGILHLDTSVGVTLPECLALLPRLESLLTPPLGMFTASQMAPPFASLADNKKPRERVSSSSAGTWKTLGLGGVGEFFTNPSLPKMEMPFDLPFTKRSDGTSPNVEPYGLSELEPTHLSKTTVPNEPSLPERKAKIRQVSTNWIPSLPTFNVFGKPKAAVPTGQETGGVTDSSQSEPRISNYDDVAAEAKAFEQEDEQFEGNGHCATTPGHKRSCDNPEAIPDALTSGSRNPGHSAFGMTSIRVQDSGLLTLFVGLPGDWRQFRLYKVGS